MTAIATPATDWGKVELDVIRRLQAQLEVEDVVNIDSAISEGNADEQPKGYASIYTISNGTRVDRTGKSGGGYLDLVEDWELAVVIYAQDGRTVQEARFGSDGLHALAARVEGILNGYFPNEQEHGALELRRDEPVQEYEIEAGSHNFKVRQVYRLRGSLRPRVTGDAVAA